MHAGLKSTLFNVATRWLGDKDDRILLPVLKGPAMGMRFRLDFKHQMETAYFFGTYELNIVRALQKICRPGWVVWDCGIYLGYYTSLFAKWVGPTGTVVACEPDIRNQIRAEENLKLNHLSNVVFVPAAIGASRGEIDFILSDNTNSHIPSAYVGATPEEYQKIERRDSVIKIHCLSLDELYLRGDVPPPHLIKIDIEGAEKEALPNCHRLVNKVRPLIVLELHNPECDAAAWDFAQATGYSLRCLDTGALIQKKEQTKGTLLCFPRESGARF